MEQESMPTRHDETESVWHRDCPRARRILLVLLALTLYGGSYMGLRLSHFIVHRVPWISCEYGGMVHRVSPSWERARRQRQFLYAAYSPLMVVEELAHEAAGVFGWRLTFRTARRPAL